MREFSVLQCQLIQLLQLKAEQCDLGTGFQTALAQSLQLVLIATPVPAEASHVVQKRRLTQKLIQQAQMGSAIEQRLMFVLTVDVDQHLADFLEHLQGHGKTIDPGTGPSVVGHDAAQQTEVGFVFVPKFVFL